MLQAQPPETRSYSFADALQLVARRWWMIAGSVAVAVALALVVLARWQPTYEASQIIAPRTVKGNPLAALSDLPFGIGAGLTGSSSPDNMARFTVTLTSPQVAARVLEHEGLIRQVFAGEWDARERRWVAPEGFAMSVRSALAELGGQSAWRPPDALRLADYVRSNVVADPLRTGNFYVLKYRHPDRSTALRFLQVLTQETDERLRELDIESVRQNIQYLTNELRTVQLAEARQSLAAQLSAEYLRQMALMNNQSYSIETVAEPFVGPEPTHPQPLLILATATTAGALFGLFLALLWPTRRL